MNIAGTCKKYQSDVISHVSFRDHTPWVYFHKAVWTLQFTFKHQKAGYGLAHSWTPYWHLDELNQLPCLLHRKGLYLECGNNISTVLHIWFDIFTAMGIKSNIFWDVASFSRVELHRRFRGTHYLLLQDRRVNLSRNQVASLMPVSCGLLLGIIFLLKMETRSSET
jgi:hypothetical protein